MRENWPGDVARRRIGEFLKRWGPAVAWMGLIFFISAQSRLPHVEESWLDLLIKKGGHMAGYAVLAGLLWRAINGRRGTRTALLALALSLAYAAGDEYHQTFVSGRNGTAADVVIDGIGALLAVLILWNRASGRRILTKTPKYDTK